MTSVTSRSRAARPRRRIAVPLADPRRADLERCAARCAERAWRLARALVRDPSDAEDVVQRAFAVAAAKSARLPVDDPWPWLATIITFEARNHIRGRRRRPRLALDDADSMVDPRAVDPVEEAGRRELAVALHAALDRLPDAEREAILLTKLSGLSTREAAEVMGSPVGTVKSHVHRGVGRLRERLASLASGLDDAGIARAVSAIVLGLPAGGLGAATERWLAAAGGLVPTGAPDAVGSAAGAGRDAARVAGAVALAGTLAAMTVWLLASAAPDRSARPGALAGRTPDSPTAAAGRSGGASDDGVGATDELAAAEGGATPSGAAGPDGPALEAGRDRAGGAGAAGDAPPRDRVLAAADRPWDARLAVTAIAICPDGAHFATGDDGGGVRVWDASTGRVVATLRRKGPSPVRDVAWSPDHDRVVSTSTEKLEGMKIDHGVIRTFDAATGAAGPVIEAHVWEGGTAAVGLGGRILAGGHNFVTLFDASGATLHELSGAGGIERVAIAPDGTRAAFEGTTAGGDWAVRVFDLDTGEMLRELVRDPGAREAITRCELRDCFAHQVRWGPSPPRRATDVAWSPDGRRVAAVGPRGLLAIWDAASGEVVARREVLGAIEEASPQPFGEIEPHRVRSDLSRVAFAGDGRIVAVVDGSLSIARVEGTEGAGPLTRLEAAAAEDGPSTVLSLSVAPDGLTAITGHRDGRIRRWDLVGDREIPIDDAAGAGGHRARIQAAAVAPDGTRAATADEDGVVVLWNEAWEVDRIIRLDKGVGVTALAFSDDGSSLAIGGIDGRVEIVATATGETRTSLHLENDPMLVGLAWSPDGDWLLLGAGPRHGGAHLLETATGRLVEIAEAEVTAVAWPRASDGSRGGRVVVATGLGEEVVLIVYSVDDEDAPREHHRWAVTQPTREIFMLRDGELLTGHDRGELARWKLETGQQLTSPPAVAAPAPSTPGALHPDGELMATPVGDRSVIEVRRVDTGEVVQRIEGHRGEVSALVFTPDGAALVTGGEDQTVRVSALTR